jgi:hypothetical protein
VPEREAETKWICERPDTIYLISFKFVKDIDTPKA